MKIPKLSFFYIFVLLLSAYSIIQYLTGWGISHELKDWVFNLFLWNVVLILFCIIRFILSKIAKKIIVRVFDWCFIISNILILVFGFYIGSYSQMFTWFCVIISFLELFGII